MLLGWFGTKFCIDSVDCCNCNSRPLCSRSEQWGRQHCISEPSLWYLDWGAVVLPVYLYSLAQLQSSAVLALRENFENYQRHSSGFFIVQTLYWKCFLPHNLTDKTSFLWSYNFTSMLPALCFFWGSIVWYPQIAAFYQFFSVTRLQFVVGLLGWAWSC